MVSTIAAALLAAAVPSDKLSSVATAAYWYKKDDRGKGDSISEKAKPKRFPAFAVGDDLFLIQDPFVREKHLDRIEILFNGDKVPAKEVARIECPEAVVLKAGRAVKGISPLVFVKGDPVEKETWRWYGDSLTVEASDVRTNAQTTVSAATGRVFRRGDANALYLDKDRRAVWLDFGSRMEVPGGDFAYVPPAEWTRHPADSFERSAEAVEKTVAEASVGVLLRLETEEKEARRSYSRYSDDSGKNEIDAVGFAIGGKVIVPCDLGGDKIARLQKAEATFPDGTSTNLVFVGALAEWNAILLDVPDVCKAKLRPLAIAEGAADDFDNQVAWSVSVENENGRIVADATRRRFGGVDFLRGAVFAPHVVGGGDWSERRARSFVLDADGRIAVFDLARRFRAERWSSSEKESVATADLARFIAGEGVNPEFAPRREDERNRLVWLGVETVPLTDALARERKAQSFMKDYSRPPYVTEVYPGSPALTAGLKVGDVLLAVRRGNEAEREIDADRDYSTRDWGAFFASDYGYSLFSVDATPWPNVENSINKLLTQYGVGAKVTLVYARDGQRRETAVLLKTAPVHYMNAPKARNRALGLSVRDMTFEVRRFFKFDDAAPGVVVAKVKPGSPAAVAGLKPFELITEVNGGKVSGAKDFAAKIKGQADLVFAVRRLAQTRLVKLHVDNEPEKEKGQ
ncbi:MAG: PDZ domain-containing protein [Kiritimatiellae bacterium]|nr:PDZ domain-containing protein [Kiritimatiellia bacterium]